MSVTLCQFKQGEEKRWDAYVTKNPNGGHCHLSGWRRVISKSYGHKPYYLWDCTDQGEITGILPIILMRSLRFELTFVSLPFLDDGGILADNTEIAKALLQKAVELAQSEQAESIDFRHRLQSQLGLSAHGEKITLVLELVDDPDVIWKGFSAKVRNQVRKAGKSDLSVSWHTMDGLEDFYQVFAINMRSLGSPVHSIKLFSEILKAFGGQAKIILVKKGEQTVGGGLTLRFNKTVSIPWASSLRTFRSQCPNNLLYWEAIRWACESGCNRFDFGRSSPGSGTYRFKKQWGAIEEPLSWESWGKGEGAAIQSDDPRFNAVTKLWSSLPLAFTKILGPIIRGRLSN